MASRFSDQLSIGAATDLRLLCFLLGRRCRLTIRCIRTTARCRAVAVICVGPRDQDIALMIECGSVVLHHNHLLTLLRRGAAPTACLISRSNQLTKHVHHAKGTGLVHAATLIWWHCVPCPKG